MFISKRTVEAPGALIIAAHLARRRLIVRLERGLVGLPGAALAGIAPDQRTAADADLDRLGAVVGDGLRGRRVAAAPAALGVVGGGVSGGHHFGLLGALDRSRLPSFAIGCSSVRQLSTQDAQQCQERSDECGRERERERERARAAAAAKTPHMGCRSRLSGAVGQRGSAEADRSAGAASASSRLPAPSRRANFKTLRTTGSAFEGRNRERSAAAGGDARVLPFVCARPDTLARSQLSARELRPAATALACM